MEPYDNNPSIVYERMRRVGSDILGLFKGCNFIADAGLVDRVSGNTTWIQDETVLADWWNTRTDYAASGWPVVTGPVIPRFLVVLSFIANRSASSEECVRKIESGTMWREQRVRKRQQYMHQTKRFTVFHFWKPPTNTIAQIRQITDPHYII